MTLLTMLARLGAVLSLLLIGSRIVKRLNLFMFYARCGLGWLRQSLKFAPANRPLAA